MSHYLSSLIERAEGRAAVLERRPRALFEPASLRAQRTTVPEPETEDAPVETEQPRAPTPKPVQEPDIVSPRDPGVRANAVSPAAMRTVGVEMPKAAVAVAPAPRVPGEPPAPVLKRDPALQSPPPEARGARLPPQPDAPLIRIAAPAAGLRPTAQRIAAEPLREPMAIQPPKTAPRSQPPETEGRARPAPRQARPQLPDPRRPVLVREHRPALPLAKAQLAAQTPPPAAASAPAPVHISIGRVEVRASSAAAESGSRTSRPSEPRLKLEDYLRQRRGGR
jgi:hypothetical protein